MRLWWSKRFREDEKVVAEVREAERIRRAIEDRLLKQLVEKALSDNRNMTKALSRFMAEAK